MTPTRTGGPTTTRPGPPPAKPGKGPKAGKTGKTGPSGRSGKSGKTPHAGRGMARIDPRIHQRRTQVVREAGRRRRRVLLILLAVIALVVGALFLLHTKVMAARAVTVVGSVHTPTDQIVAQAGLTDHPPLIDVNTGAVAARLEQLPWVSTAAVSRSWPDGVRIVITERTPVAAVSTSATAPTTAVTPAGATTTTPPTTPATSSWALVDRTGRVLASAATAPAGLVQLVGPSAPGAPGTVLRSAAPGLAVAASLPKAFAGQVTEIDVTTAGQVTLKLTSPVTVNLGTTAQLEQKYEDVASLLSGASLTAGDVLDVSVPESPTVTGG